MQPAQLSLFQPEHLPPPRMAPPDLPEPDVAAAVRVLADLIAKTVAGAGRDDGDE